MKITGFDPTRPIGSWKKAWSKLPTKAGLQGSIPRLTTFRDHALLTNPNVSVQTVKAVAGHVSLRMVDRYTHIGLAAKQSALEGAFRAR